MIKKSNTPREKPDTESLSIKDARVTIVASRFNGFIVDRLLTACLKTLRDAGMHDDDMQILRVPGAFEIPVAAKAALGQIPCDAVIALGAVIRGETPHFDYICRECAGGLSRLALDSGKPVIFGVLTVDNSSQALERSGDEESNKGSEAAVAAIDMINLMRSLH